MTDMDTLRVVIFIGPPRVSPSHEGELAGRRVLCTRQGLLPALERGEIPEAVFVFPEEIPPEIRSRLRDHRVKLITPLRETPHADVEAALNYTITTGGTDILLLGVWSDDPSEALAHILLLAKPEWGAARVWFIHGPHAGHLLRHGEGVSMQEEPGTRVALIPLSPKVTEVTTQGTSPLLRHVEMALGATQHIYLSHKEGRVWIGAGRLLVLISPPGASVSH